MTDSDEIAIRPDGISWREIDDEIVVLDLETSRYIQLNASGSVLWKRLSEAGATATSLAADLVARFEIDGESATADVVAFLELCSANGLLAS